MSMQLCKSKFKTHQRTEKLYVINNRRMKRKKKLIQLINETNQQQGLNQKHRMPIKWFLQMHNN